MCVYVYVYVYMCICVWYITYLCVCVISSTGRMLVLRSMYCTVRSTSTCSVSETYVLLKGGGRGGKKKVISKMRRKKLPPHNSTVEQDKCLSRNELGWEDGFPKEEERNSKEEGRTAETFGAREVVVY